MTDLEVFVKMNENDTKNGTQTLGMCYDYANMNKVKRGAVISMAIPFEQMLEIMENRRIPVLLLIDRIEYFKIKTSSK